MPVPGFVLALAARIARAGVRPAAADAAAADGPGEAHAKRGLAGRAMWSHACTHVSDRTFERVFVEQAAAGAEQAKQGEFTLSSRFL